MSLPVCGSVFAPVCRAFFIFRNGFIFGWSGILHPAPKVEDRRLSAVRSCAISILILGCPPYVTHNHATPFCQHDVVTSHRSSGRNEQQSPDQLTRAVTVLDCWTLEDEDTYFLRNIENIFTWHGVISQKSWAFEMADALYPLCGVSFRDCLKHVFLIEMELGKR